MELNDNEKTLLRALRAAGDTPLTAKEAAAQMFGQPDPTPEQIRTARNALRRPAKEGLTDKLERGKYTLSLKGSLLLKKVP